MVISTVQDKKLQCSLGISIYNSTIPDSTVPLLLQSLHNTTDIIIQLEAGPFLFTKNTFLFLGGRYLHYINFIASMYMLCLICAAFFWSYINRNGSSRYKLGAGIKVYTMFLIQQLEYVLFFCAEKFGGFCVYKC